jgi:uncharacterized protein (TIGR04255 family)
VPVVLPEFGRPPLIEVVCGLQFEAIALKTVHLGDFWQAMREIYPSFEDHPPLADIVTEGDALHLEHEQYLEMPPLRRVFFVDKTKNFLLQLSASRFIANWRRMNETDEYPRFDAAYAKFTDGWRRFQEYVLRNDIGQLRPSHYELTYINHIPEASGHLHAQADELFTFFRWPTLQPDLFDSPLRGTNLRFNVRFKDARGNLTVVLTHGERSDGRRIFILELTARGAAAADGSDREQWFSFAHEAIVQTFVSITTAKAHERWGRKQ